MPDWLGIRFLDEAAAYGSVVLECDHDPLLVGVSWLVALLASWVCLQVAGQIRTVTVRMRAIWIGLCALAFGGGVWSMHFLAMLAYRTPIAISYDWPITTGSLLLAVGGAYLAIDLVNRGSLRIWKIIAGGLLLGLTLISMHYMGMQAIRSEGRFFYDRELFFFSVAIGIIAAASALTLTQLVPRLDPHSAVMLQLTASLLMSFAITGMHYTGMAAAVLYVDQPLVFLQPSGGIPTALAVSVTAVTLTLLSIAMLNVVYGRRLAAESEERQALTAELYRHNQIIDSIPDAILFVDEHLTVQNANESADQLFKPEGGDAAWPPLYDYIPGIIELDKAARRLGGKQFMEASAVDARGREFPIELSLSNVTVAGSSLLVVVCRDISARKRAEAHIQGLLEENKRLAITDTLTGLPNRRHFVQSIEKEINRCERYGHELCVLLVDLDHFKRVNDTWGHAVGDAALRVMSGVLRSIARDSDLFCRFGGEEFLLALPETSTGEARVVAERLRESLAESAVDGGDGQHFNITCSIGVAQWRTGDTFDVTVGDADKALYLAKEQGRNRVAVAPVRAVENERADSPGKQAVLQTVPRRRVVRLRGDDDA